MSAKVADASAFPLSRLANEGGIILSLGIYGIIQERIMTQPYGNQFFRASVFLVLCNRLVAIAYTLCSIRGKSADLRNKAPLWKYLAISSSSVAATFCQYEALKFVSFPVQMLGKSFKMIPVMLWGAFLSKRFYGSLDWLVAAVVTAGVTAFMLTGEIKSRYASPQTSVYGLAHLIGFLVCDGFTSTFQERLFRDHEMSTENQMLYVNCGSATVSLASLAFSGDGSRTLAFCLEHPDFVVHAVSLSAVATAGQSLIYTQVKEFGALALATTMNLRQVVSIACSYLYYVHPISTQQFVSLIAVFTAIFGKSYVRLRERQSPSERVEGRAAPRRLGKVHIVEPEPPLIRIEPSLNAKDTKGWMSDEASDDDSDECTSMRKHPDVFEAARQQHVEAVVSPNESVSDNTMTGLGRRGSSRVHAGGLAQ